MASITMASPFESVRGSIGGLVFYNRHGKTYARKHVIPANPDTEGQRAVRRAFGDDAGMRMLLPVGRSGLAIAAGYLGLVSILLIPAPFALILGILAIREIRRSRQTDKRVYGMGRAIFGIAMGALFTVIGLLMLGAGPLGRTRF